MAEPISLIAEYPLGGLNKSTAFALQKPNTTPSQDNVWPTQWSTGRSRGGVRPGIILTSSVGIDMGTPYNWSSVSTQWAVGISVTASTGTHVSQDGANWYTKISEDPSSTFASSAVMNNVLYQASAAKANVKTYTFAGVFSSGGTSGTLTVGTYEDGTAKGVVPDNCGLVYVHNGRLILAGDASDPHIIYMSRINDPTDWDFAQFDEGSAWASSGESGKIQEPITSVFSHGNNCLIIGGPDSIHVIRGDVRQGGNIDRFELDVGPLMQSALCKTAGGYTMFLSRVGLHVIPPGCVDNLDKITTEIIPNDLAGLDPAAGDWASLAFDARWDVVHIYVHRAAGTDAAYVFDLVNRGFHPMSFDAGSMRLAVTLKRYATQTKGSVLAVTSGGSVYGFDADDTTESIDAHVFIGPLTIGSPLMEGVFQEISCVLGENSGEVSFDIHVGQSAQEAYNATAQYTGTFDIDGLNWKHWPRLRGVSAWVKIYSTGTTRWSMEELVGIAYPVAARRVQNA